MKQTLYTLFVFCLLTITFNSKSFASEKSVTSAPAPTCDAPANIAVNNITSSTAIISWDNVPGAFKYTVRRRIVGETTWKVSSVSAPATQLKLHNLSSGSDYEIEVRTFCTSGFTPHSDYVPGPNFTTLALCPAPDKLFHNNITSTTALASWITTLNSTQYRLRIRPLSGGLWTVYIVAGGSTTSFEFTGLTPSTDYEWQIRSRCGLVDDISAYSESDTFATHCGQPQNVLVGSVNSSSAIASWDAVDDAYKYRLRRRAVGDLDWVYSSILAPENQRKFSNLLSNTEYEFEVQSYCDVDLTDSSGYVPGPNFTTGSDCLVPTGLSTTNVTDVSAEANWNTATNATQYRLRYRHVGDLSWITTIIRDDVATSFQMSGLTPSNDYEWQIRAVCQSITDYSAFSETQLFTTAASRMAMPEEMSLQVETLNLYPNPNNGLMQIEMSSGNKSSGAAVVEIFNTIGEIVYAGNIALDNGYINGRISLSNEVPDGIYSLRIIQNGETYSTNFILNK